MTVSDKFKSYMRQILDKLSPEELRWTRQSCNGRLSKSKITEEHQDKLQAARKKPLIDKGE